MSKGSKRRKEDTEKISDNWDDIDWGKPKKKDACACANPLINYSSDPCAVRVPPNS